MGGKKLHHKQKAFTIIELLVVIAIIGILAALGIVAYSGYTSGAKKNASKIIHSKTVRFLSAEITLCSLLQDGAIMNNRISCSFKKGDWNGCNSNDCKAQMIIDVLDVFKDKNPYESKKPAVFPAPDSTETLHPSFKYLFTVSGVAATRVSPETVSGLMFLIINIPLIISP